MSTLVIRSGHHQGQRLVLPQKEIVVGRDESCDLRVNSSLISRRHCSIRRTGSTLVVRDLNSQNGTFVNDVAISQPTLLEPGDRIRVGAMVFEVAASESVTLPGTAKKKKEEKVSEAEISDWLADDGPKRSGDTALIGDVAPKSLKPAIAPSSKISPDDSSIILPRPDQLATSAGGKSAANVKEGSAEISSLTVNPTASVQDQAARIILEHHRQKHGKK